MAGRVSLLYAIRTRKAANLLERAEKAEAERDALRAKLDAAWRERRREVNGISGNDLRWIVVWLDHDNSDLTWTEYDSETEAKSAIEEDAGKRRSAREAGRDMTCHQCQKRK